MNISFRSIENYAWRELASWQNDRFPLPSWKTIRRRLEVQVDIVEQALLSGRVPGSKCALAIDNWSSPGTRLSFMAIVATFIDINWEYREALIGFEPLDTAHTGKELATILRRVISRFKLDGQVHAITTDNASNNSTMIEQLDEMFDELSSSSGNFYDTIHHIPCFAHIIQLAERALLGSIRICPTNSQIELDWNQQVGQAELQTLKQSKGLPWTLGKVYFTFYSNNYSNQAYFLI
jgi:hypothetical protein